MSVQLWKVLVPALGLSMLWTACKKEESATHSEQQISKDPMYSGTVEDDPAMVKKTSLLVSADYLTTVHTARKGGKPGTTTPVDTTTVPTTPPPDTTTKTPTPPADTTVITPAPLPSSYSLVMPSVRYQGTEGS